MTVRDCAAYQQSTACLNSRWPHNRYARRFCNMLMNCSLIVVWLPLRTVRGSSDQSLVDLANRVEHLCRMARPESFLSRQFKINSSPMLNPLQTEFLGGT